MAGGGQLDEPHGVTKITSAKASAAAIRTGPD
jgi:hypothetical protein